MPPETWEQKLIEEVVLAQVTEQRRKRRWSIFFKLLALVFVLMFFVQNYAWDKGSMKQPHTALIDIQGVIGAEVEADDVATSLRQAMKEDSAKAIILRINSPGGSPVQAGYIFDEIHRLRALYPHKKVYAVIEEIGASAAYYIAAAADDIYANKASFVGSIGAIIPNFGFVELMKKVGVEQRTLTSGNHKGFLDPFSPVKPDEQAFAQELLNTVHQQFIQAVKEGRGSRLKSDPNLFSGLVWTGQQALPLGLIDGLGSAGYVAREIVGIEEIYDYTISPNWLDKLTHRMGAEFRHQLTRSSMAFSWQ